MKKMLLGFAIMMTMAASVTAFATSINNISEGLAYIPTATHVTSQGTHCNGTVGCGCPGFSPITNGDVWQQAIADTVVTREAYTSKHSLRTGRGFLWHEYAWDCLDQAFRIKSIRK